MIDREKLLTNIAKCDDAQVLRNWIENARRKKDGEVEAVALRRLITLVPNREPGTVEHDFWQMIQAFEYTLSEERNRTTRLGRTRQKVDRVGVVKTLTDWALSAQETDGFRMLLERDMAEFTGEAIVLRHPDKFDATIRAAARARLVQAGVDVTKLPSVAEQ